VTREDIVEQYKPTNYDPDNGPVYQAVCDTCGARGPVVGFAADAIPVLGVRTRQDYIDFSHQACEKSNINLWEQ
jgi:hypothetical protein